MFFYFKLHLFAFLFNSFLLYVMILSSRYVLIFVYVYLFMYMFSHIYHFMLYIYGVYTA